MTSPLESSSGPLREAHRAAHRWYDRDDRDDRDDRRDPRDRDNHEAKEHLECRVGRFAEGISLKSEGEGHLDAPLQVVAGKGGVGRTVVASAIALRSARQGRRTLLLEVNAQDGAFGHLEVEPSVDHPAEVHPNLWLCRMTPSGSLAEYALMVLRFRALKSLVFDNRLVRYFLRSIPSLAEFTMLGKAWFHTTEVREDGSPKYERVVIDAPATGHAITFLSVARIVCDVSPSGLMKAVAGRMADMIEAPSTRLHVVCIPEEMPVNEGIELVAVARERLRMALGYGIVNRVVAAVESPEEETVLRQLEKRSVVERRLRPYVASAAQRRFRCALQAGHMGRFVRESGLPALIVAESQARGLALVEHVRTALDRPIHHEGEVNPEVDRDFAVRARGDA